MTAEAARLLGLHVGESVPYGLFTNEQTSLPGMGTPSVQPHRRIDARLVGLVALNSEIVQDQVNQLPALVLFTPALAQQVLADSGRGASGVTYYGLQLDHGSRDIAGVERALTRLLPRGAEYNFHTTAPVETKVGQVVRPVAIALGVFGAIAALTALVIAGQVISRQLRTASEDLTVLRALGAGPKTIAADVLFGVLFRGSARIAARSRGCRRAVAPVTPRPGPAGLSVAWTGLRLAGPGHRIGGADRWDRLDGSSSRLPGSAASRRHQIPACSSPRLEGCAGDHFDRTAGTGRRRGASGA